MRQTVVGACAQRCTQAAYRKGDDELGWIERLVDEGDREEYCHVSDARYLRAYAASEHFPRLVPKLAELAIRLASVVGRDALPFHPAFFQIRVT